MDDGDFWKRLRKAYQVPARFNALADELTPPEVNEELVAELTSKIQDYAKRLWMCSATSLTPIGSMSRGTAILKARGERSDLDYALTKGSKETITEGEWDALFEKLGADLDFDNVRMKGKAISFFDRHSIPWDLVPTDGHFTYDFLPFPTLLRHLNAETREAVEERKSKVFQHHGARACAKILKRLFPNIKGYIIELLLLYVHQEKGPGQNGKDWFKDAMREVQEFPQKYEKNPLEMMLKDMNQSCQAEGKTFEENLNKASHTVHQFYHPDWFCLPDCRMKFLLQIVGGLLGLKLAVIFFCLFFPAQKRLEFSQKECETPSCFCNDCNQEVWAQWWTEPEQRAGSVCQVPFVELEFQRCSLRLVVRCLRILAFMMVTTWTLWASRVRRKGHGAPAVPGRTRGTSEWLSRLVLMASMMRFSSCLSDVFGGPGIFEITVSCLFLNIADVAAMSFSWLMLLHVLHVSFFSSFGRKERLFGHFVGSFLLVVVCASTVLVIFARSLLNTQGFRPELDFKDLIFQQHNFFNAVCLFVNTSLTFLAAYASPAELASICWQNFAVCLAWCLLVFGQIFFGILWLGEFSHVSFLANIFKSLFIILNWILVLMFAKDIS